MNPSSTATTFAGTRQQQLTQQQQQQPQQLHHQHAFHPYRHPANQPSFPPPQSHLLIHPHVSTQPLPIPYAPPHHPLLQTQRNQFTNHLNPQLPQQVQLQGRQQQPGMTQLVHPHASLHAPPFPPTTAVYPGFSAALEQRRLSLSALPPSTAAPQTIPLSFPAPAPAPASASTPRQALSTTQTLALSAAQTQSQWQGVVATGAMPVRQAFHSYISTSYEKPPASREEAQKALEEMFRLRAEKVRQSIEHGQLATTEALQHRVIRRRESVILQEGKDKEGKDGMQGGGRGGEEGEEGISNNQTEGQTTQKEGETSKTGQGNNPARRNSAESQSVDTVTTEGDILMMDRQSPTLSWGLSDDDLMASLSSFTAKLGDSLLAEQRQQLHGTDSLQNHNHNHNHNHNNSASYTSNTLTQDKTRKNLHQNQNTSLQSQNIGGVPVTAFDASLGLGSSSSSQSSSSAACLGSTPQIPVFSPPSLTERSPTTSTESLSPSPWMPWLAHEHDPLLQRISNNPETIYPALMETSMAPAAHQGLLIQDSNNNEAYIPTKLQLLSRTGGNPYMQYLQAIHPSQSQPQVEPQAQQQQVPTQVTGYVQPSMTMSSHQPAYVDPQWQATMMAMMMDQNPVLEPRHGEYRHAQRH